MAHAKWEYEVITLDVARLRAEKRDDHITAKMQEHGADGWELVSVIGDETWVHLFYKRPKHER